jgi:hypothetical protein
LSSEYLAARAQSAGFNWASAGSDAATSKTNIDNREIFITEFVEAGVPTA